MRTDSGTAGAGTAAEGGTDGAGDVAASMFAERAELPFDLCGSAGSRMAAAAVAETGIALA